MRRGIAVELHGLGLTGLGIPFQIREARADQEQPLALLHGLLGGPGSQQADPAGGEGRIVGDRRLAQQRLDDRRGQDVRQPLQLLGGTEGARCPARMTSFFWALRSSAAALSVSACGTTIGGRQAVDVWPRTICIDEISSETV